MTDSVTARAIRQSVAHLGEGVEGPWEDRTRILEVAREQGRINYPIVKAWLNQTYSVQLLRHDSHPGVDHLLVRRHDEGLEFPWAHLQRIKDRFAEDGQFRWAMEAFPPTLAVVDNANLRHVWVMPKGWEPPVDLRDVKT